MTNDAWPTIDPAVWTLRPDYAAVSIRARGARNGPSTLLTEAGLATVTQDDLAFAPWAAAHLESWREAFRAFGSKPQRTPCSAEALRKRVERDGALPAINAVVDLYNAASVRYAIPFGGEDMAKYHGIPHLVRATGTEPFETMKDGAPYTEPADAGEVIWRDDRGVTCRRWNWRQSPRSGLGIDTTEMWFIVERLDPMPMAQLEAAGEALLSGLKRLAPGAAFDTKLLVR